MIFLPVLGICQPNGVIVATTSSSSAGASSSAATGAAAPSTTQSSSASLVSKGLYRPYATSPPLKTTPTAAQTGPIPAHPAYRPLNSTTTVPNSGDPFGLGLGPPNPFLASPFAPTVFPAGLTPPTSLGSTSASAALHSHLVSPLGHSPNRERESFRYNNVKT